MQFGAEQGRKLLEQHLGVDLRFEVPIEYPNIPNVLLLP